MDHPAILAERFPTPFHCDPQVQQTKSSVFHEETRTLGSTSSVPSNPTFKVEILNGLRHVDVNLDAR